MKFLRLLLAILECTKIYFCALKQNFVQLGLNGADTLESSSALIYYQPEQSFYAQISMKT